MKRALLFILVLALFVGCSAEPNDTTPSTQPTEPSGIYDAAHTLETQSNGAVRVFSPEQDCNAVAFMGKNLLTFRVADGKTEVTSYAGQNLSRYANARLNGELLPGNKDLRLDQQRIGYYDQSENSVVFLDSGLQETGRVRMPQDMVGTPVISETMAAVFYCTTSEIRALSLESGINRLIRQQNCQSMAVEATLLADTVLMCAITDNDGNSYVEFISAQTGETLGADSSLVTLDVWQNQCFLQRLDGFVTEYIFTAADGSLQCFTPDKKDAAVHCLMAMNAVATVSEEESGMCLQLVDLAGGKQMAKILLQDIAQVKGLISDPEQDSVWFLAQDTANGKPLLCSWAFENSAVSDDTVYTAPRYTLENPDTAGLNACRELANALEERYGVAIFLADAPLASQDYALIYEHQPTVFKAALEQLDKIMAVFPEGFLKTVAQVSDSEKLHIGLVRGLKSKNTGVPEDIAAVQYWVDGNAWMALSVGDNIQQLFCHQLAHVLDTFVYSKNVAFDEWSKLNPKEFSYDLSYFQYMDREESEYLSGKTRAFIDSYSMTFPKEDRARIFDCALAEGNAELFASKTMQSKLRQLCVGIRNAFDWKKDERAFLWEQYLETPLAYNKK